MRKSITLVIALMLGMTSTNVIWSQVSGGPGGPAGPGGAGNAGGGLDGRARSRSAATIRVPARGGAEAAAKAGAHFDPNRVRMNPDSGPRHAAGAGGGRARPGGESKAALNSKRKPERRPDSGPFREAPNVTYSTNDHARPGPTRESDARLPTDGQPFANRLGPRLRRGDHDVQFSERLATIDRVRDAAMARGDVQSLQDADAMEQRLRTEHRDARSARAADDRVNPQGPDRRLPGERLGNRAENAVQGGTEMEGEPRARVSRLDPPPANVRAFQRASENSRLNRDGPVLDDQGNSVDTRWPEGKPSANRLRPGIGGRLRGNDNSNSPLPPMPPLPPESSLPELLQSPQETAPALPQPLTDGTEPQ